MFRIFELMTSEQEIKENADYYNNIVNKLSETVNSSNNENKEEELNEYFYKDKSRADIKKSISGTILQLIQHTLIKLYCYDYTYNQEVLNHWDGEIKGFILTIRNKSKSYLKEKLLTETFNDIKLYNINTLNKLLIDKIQKENNVENNIHFNQKRIEATSDIIFTILDNIINVICDFSANLNDKNLFLNYEIASQKLPK